MKKVVTAIGNEILNEKLRESGKFEILAKDIFYKEGIIELLHTNSKIDVLIVSEILEGEIDFKELINIIKQVNEKIEIIVFLEKENVELKSFLYSKGIYKIYENNEIDIETFIINLQDNIEDKTNELNEEIRKLKEQIKMQEEKSIFEKEYLGKITVIVGHYGSGKSILSCILCKEFAKLKKKTLIIDFDIYNSSINTLFNVSKYKTDCKQFNVKDQVIRISKYEYVLCSVDMIFSDENSVDYINLEKIMNEFKKEYDQIIIDTTSNYKYKYFSKVLNLADDIVYIVVPNISELKKSFNLYEICINDFCMPLEKVKLVVNKSNTYSVDNLIITKMFNVSKISGEIKYNEKIEGGINGTIKKLKLKAVVGGK